MSKLIKLTKDNQDNRSTKTIELMEDNQYNDGQLGYGNNSHHGPKQYYLRQLQIVNES